MNDEWLNKITYKPITNYNSTKIENPTNPANLGCRIKCLALINAAKPQLTDQPSPSLQYQCPSGRISRQPCPIVPCPGPFLL